MKKKDVIRHFGGLSKTAKALRINASSVTRWGDDVPHPTDFTIELLTKGALKTDETIRMLGSISEAGISDDH